jgi:hypothetical protein
MTLSVAGAVTWPWAQKCYLRLRGPDKCATSHSTRELPIMLERLILPNTHAISIILKDHDKVKDLFDRFEKAKSAAEK